jgi:hypothetical protein
MRPQMLEVLIWGVLSTLITIAVGGTIVVTERGRRRDTAALELIEEVGDRVEALNGVEARLDAFEARLDAAGRTREAEHP